MKIGTPSWDTAADLAAAALEAASKANGTAEEIIDRAEQYFEFLRSIVLSVAGTTPSQQE